MKKSSCFFVAVLSVFLLIGCGSGDSASDAGKTAATPAAPAGNAPIAATPSGKSASDLADGS